MMLIIAIGHFHWQHYITSSNVQYVTIAVLHNGASTVNIDIDSVIIT
jgi:hypothetical protein